MKKLLQMELQFNSETSADVEQVSPACTKPHVSGRRSFVDYDTVLEVGKYYYVKCAIMSNGESEYFVPVIGEPHNDNQFSFKDRHIHIDGRFVGRQQFSRLDIEKTGHTNQVCSYAPSNSSFVIKELVVKRLKCKRLTTGINPPKERFKVDYWGNKNESQYHKWVDTMIGKSCKGKKCPHLGAKMKEQDGFIVCPLHSLKGTVTDEVIVGFACH